MQASVKRKYLLRRDIKALPSIDQLSLSEDSFDVIRLYRALWSGRRIIGIVATLTTVVVIVVTLFLPRIYIAEATVLPMTGNDPTSMIAAGLSSQLGPAASILGGVHLGGGRTADLVEILSSRTMAGRVIERCTLEKELKGWKTRNGLVSKVQKMTKVTAPSMANKVVAIRVKAPSADLAARMANAYVEELKDTLDQMGYSTAAKNRRFVEEQLSKTQVELKRAEEKLTEFQSQNQLASLPETVMASIRSISDLEAQRINAGIQVKTTTEAMGIVRSKVNALQADPNTLVDLEVRRHGLKAQEAELARARENFVARLRALPPKATEMARLQRDLQVQNAVYMALRQQYLTAVISENKDSDAFLPLDKAVPPDLPSSPRRTLNAVAGLVLGGLLGSLIALLKERFSSIASELRSNSG